MTDDIAEQAWAAGLFEGEGFMSLVPQRGKRRPTVHCGINLTDFDVLARFAEIIGVGKLDPKPFLQTGYRPRWTWRAAGREAQMVIRELYPWMGNRRRVRADACLDALEQQFAPRPCVVCGNLFVRKRHAIYCSKNCCNKAYARRQKAKNV